VLGTFKDKQLYIELRPRCPKCKKEFMLDLKKFLPGRVHKCYSCGAVAQFDPDFAEKVQKQIQDLEDSIQGVYDGFSS
jgi:hypothetical protein